MVRKSVSESIPIVHHVTMSLDEFYWEVLDSVICGIVEGKAISSVGFLGDPSDRFCDVRR